MDVGEKDFRNIYKGQEVELFYSKSSPSIIRLLLSDGAIREQMNIEQRDVQVNDLITFIDLTEEQVLDTLNSISYKWEWKKGHHVYTNSQKNEAIQILGKMAILIAQSGNLDKYKKEVEAAGFQKVDPESKKSLYQNGNIQVSIELRPTPDEQRGLILMDVVKVTIME